MLFSASGGGAKFEYAPLTVDLLKIYCYVTDDTPIAHLCTGMTKMHTLVAGCTW